MRRRGRPRPRHLHRLRVVRDGVPERGDLPRRQAAGRAGRLRMDRSRLVPGPGCGAVGRRRVRTGGMTTPALSSHARPLPPARSLSPLRTSAPPSVHNATVVVRADHGSSDRALHRPGRWGAPACPARAILSHDLSADSSIAYLCGNPGM